MVDITHKVATLRTAIAQAIVQVSDVATITAIKEDKVPKGNVFAMSKAAGLLGVKKTPELLPDCHPMPIEYTDIAYSIEDLQITIKVTVKTIYKTGVEVEAMHAASVVALNMYDMLKPIDKGVEIHHIKLLEKKGGKSSFKVAAADIKSAVIVCSDSISAKQNEDKAGKAIIDKLQGFGITDIDYNVIADDVSLIQEQVQLHVQAGNKLLVFTGGTGFSPRDNTPEAILPLLDKRAFGVEEAIRSYGQERMPYAMLSRSVAGTIGDALVIAVPGSTNGAVESIQAVFPHVLHVFKVLRGERH